MRGRLGSSLEDAAILRTNPYTVTSSAPKNTKRIKKKNKTTIVTLVMGKNIITNLTLLIAERR